MQNEQLHENFNNQYSNIIQSVVPQPPYPASIISSYQTNHPSLYSYNFQNHYPNSRYPYANIALQLANSNRLSGTNGAKLDMAKNNGVIELTFTLQPQQPLVYSPLVYVKYAVPYETYVKNLIQARPYLRQNPTKLIHELLTVANISDASQDLQKLPKDYIAKLVTAKGALVRTQVLNEGNKTDAIEAEIQNIIHLASNLSSEQLIKATNRALANVEDVATNYNTTPIEAQGQRIRHISEREKNQYVIHNGIVKQTEEKRNNVNPYYQSNSNPYVPWVRTNNYYNYQQRSSATVPQVNNMLPGMNTTRAQVTNLLPEQSTNNKTGLTNDKQHNAVSNQQPGPIEKENLRLYNEPVPIKYQKSRQVDTPREIQQPGLINKQLSQQMEIPPKELQQTGSINKRQLRHVDSISMILQQPGLVNKQQLQQK
ncbi:uncharacterized protein LOC126976176 [Leptidea sinapis]|uniref:uncharacterized protein LOC126976176 n=1 Tax=Leptidea sinapis TaxID=189913 RepID=UPI0021C43CFE|nr:uncharacterized protein LOC126976176 [Leptidea sinapis]